MQRLRVHSYETRPSPREDILAPFPAFDLHGFSALEGIKNVREHFPRAQFRHCMNPN